MARIYGECADFMQVVAAAIGSTTSHMRSAAVTALARLVFEFSSEDPTVQNMIPALLKTVLILSDDPSREVTKSMVVFVRVCVSAADAEQLEPLLPEILTGLLNYHRGRDRFRAKIKIIIKKLVKFFGYAALMPFVPQSDARLLTHMRKLSEREARRKNSQSYRAREETIGYDAMIDSDGEEDSDDGLTLVTGMTRKSRLSRVTSRSGKQTLKRNLADTQSLAKSTRSSKAQMSVRIKNDVDGEVSDVKDLKTVRFTEPNSDEDSSDAEIEFNESGKLVIREMEEVDSAAKHSDERTLLSLKSNPTISRRTRIDTRVKQKDVRRTMKLGQSYEAKKAGGDMKKKGQKYEPYAYVQLDGKRYSRKNRRQAVEQMSSVVQRGNKRQKR
jgi:ribosomal RNA-processing protein 12